MTVVVHSVLAVDGLMIIVGKRIGNRRSCRSDWAAYLAHGMRQVRMMAVIRRNVVTTGHPTHARVAT